MIRSHPRGDEDADQWIEKPGTGALGALHPYPFARRVDIGLFSPLTGAFIFADVVVALMVRIHGLLRFRIGFEYAKF